MHNTSLTSQQIKDEPKMSGHGQKHGLGLSQNNIFQRRSFHGVFIVAEQNKVANQGIF